jgi:hypothetical protein
MQMRIRSLLILMLLNVLNDSYIPAIKNRLINRHITMINAVQLLQMILRPGQVPMNGNY